MTGALAEFERECFTRLRERYDDLSWDTEVEMHRDAVKSWYGGDEKTWEEKAGRVFPYEKPSYEEWLEYEGEPRFDLPIDDALKREFELNYFRSNAREIDFSRRLDTVTEAANSAARSFDEFRLTTEVTGNYAFSTITSVELASLIMWAWCMKCKCEMEGVESFQRGTMFPFRMDRSTFEGLMTIIERTPYLDDACPGLVELLDYFADWYCGPHAITGCIPDPWVELDARDSLYGDGDDTFIGSYAKDIVHMVVVNRVWLAMQRKPRQVWAWRSCDA